MTSFKDFVSYRVYDGVKKRLKSVDRFEVIDHRGTDYPARLQDRGRVYAARPCKVELVCQDDGRTLKVFVTDVENTP